MADRPKIFNKMTQVNYDCIIVIIRFLNYVERLYLDSILRLGNFWYIYLQNPDKVITLLVNPISKIERNHIRKFTYNLL
jgi:hypothetical protein